MKEVTTIYTATSHDSNKKQYHLYIRSEEDFTITIQFRNGASHSILVKKEDKFYKAEVTLRFMDRIILVCDKRIGSIRWKKDKLSNSIVWLSVMDSQNLELIKENSFFINNEKQKEAAKRILEWFPFSGIMEENKFISFLNEIKTSKIKEYIFTEE